MHVGKETHVYGAPNPTLAMMVIRTCSLTVKGPGLRETPKTLTLGRKRAQRRPRGKDSSWATIYKRAITINPTVRSKNEREDVRR